MKIKNCGITLIALVVTIVVLLILAGITISLVFGPNGVINKAKEAEENTKREQVREQLELAKAPEFIEGNGKYDPDSYFQRVEDEEIIKDKNKDVVEIGEGVYEVTTAPGYIFIITLVPTKDNVEDIEIDYGGKVDGPRIRKINVTNKTTSSISIEVDTANAEGATYTYYYKKDGELDWIESGKSEENIYTFTGLEANVIYNIKVEVEKDGKKAEKETSTRTGELPEGAVQFSQVEWNNGEASTTITTSETGYTLQYQLGGIEEEKWTNTTSGTTIGNLQHGTTVYGRLFDGTNGSKNASIDVKDEMAPTIAVTDGRITTNSIEVSVQSTDNESGMADTPTYRYYIKQTNEADTAYEEQASNNNASYTFTELKQKTNYDIKVEVDGDKAGNIGIGMLLNKATGEIGGPTDGLIEGNIIASSPTWSNETASITLSTNTGLTIQYQVNGIADESWKDGTTVTGLHHKDTVYARLTDGTNVGSYASVNILDNIAPKGATIALSNTTVTSGTNVTATVTHIDNESGPNITSCRYIWNTSSAKLGTNAGAYTGGAFSSNGQQISRSMTSKGTYYLHVLTVDKAGKATETVSDAITVKQLATGISVSPSSITLTKQGETKQLTATVTPSTADNKSVTWSSSNTNVATVNSSGLVTAKGGGSATITATTKDGTNKKDTCSVTVTYPTVANKLKEGDYVSYDTSQGTNYKCIVLYNNSSYGVQIITQNIVGTIYVSLGASSFSTAMSNYNSAISKLNSEAKKYGSSIYATDVRCVGSVPNKKNSESGYYKITEFESSYSGRLRAGDNNYSTDWNQMGKLGIRKSNNHFWLASREVISGSNGINFGVRYSSGGGGVSTQNLCYIYSDGTGDALKSSSHGLRPVMTLKSTVKVIGGNGTSSSPYKLGT